MAESVDSLHIDNAYVARKLYTDNLDPTTSREDWSFAIREARKLVASALRASAYLFSVAGALRKDCGHGLAFRHLLAPPLSQDQFKLVCPSWSKSAEKDCRPSGEEAAKQAEGAIWARLDLGLIRWFSENRRPSRREIHVVLKVVPTLIAQQRFATSRRNRLAKIQEHAVRDLLDSDGWTRLPSKLIDTRAAVPLRHYMHKTRFATGAGKKAHQEVDIACGLKSTYVLAMECKVTNDETNSVKRVNDVLKKAAAWKQHWGNFVVTAALLQGVVAAKDVQRLTDAGVHVFWSHDLAGFRSWLESQISTTDDH